MKPNGWCILTFVVRALKLDLAGLVAKMKSLLQIISEKGCSFVV